MYLVPWVNRMLVFSAEMPHKIRGWHARRKRDQVHGEGVTGRICAGGMLEGGVSTYNTWPRELASASGISYNQEDFDPDRRKKKGDHWRFVPRSLCVQLRPLHSTHPYIFGNKRKRRGLSFYITTLLIFSYTA